MVLGALGAGAGVAVLFPWVSATASPTPDSADLAPAALARAGAPEQWSATGAASLSGAVLLVVASGLVAVALWRVSPAYRPVWAGYLSMVGAVSAAGLIVGFLVADDPAGRSFGSAAGVHTETVVRSGWPWVALVCFAGACLAAVMLVPPRQRKGLATAPSLQPNRRSVD